MVNILIRIIAKANKYVCTHNALKNNLLIKKPYFFILLVIIIFPCFYVDNLTIKNTDTSFKTLLKPEVNLKDNLGEEFYNAINYLHKIKHAKFDWISSSPISIPPEAVRKAGADSFLFDDIHHYSPCAGNIGLLKAIKGKFARDGIKVEYKNIIINTSVFEILASLYFILNLTANDFILMPAPTYGYYALHVNNHYIRTKFLKTNKTSKWKMLPNELDTMLIKTKAKIFLFTNPVNPTGVVYTKPEVEKLAKVFKKHRTLVIFDEIFKDVLLTQKQKPFSIGAIKGMEDLTITLNGVGKSMGLAGLRLSYCCLPNWMVTKFPKLSSGLLKPVEKAAIAALLNTESNRKYLKDNAGIYKNRLNLIKNYMYLINKELQEKFNPSSYNSRIFAKIYLEPKATNVVLLSFPGVKGKFSEDGRIFTSLDLAKYILKKTGIALLPGEAFFTEGNEMVVRIPFVAANLEKGLKALKSALLQLKA